MSYTPQPIDTSRVQLPAELRELTEMLARHTHDLWAEKRFQDGWKHGPQRDDARKEHPGLVPYEQLSEAEKDYDRRIAVENIKAVLALGYRLSR